MYYITSTPTNNNYGNPHYPAHEGDLLLPDTFLSKYAEYKGFIIPVIEDGYIVGIEKNVEAYDAYMADHPNTPAPPTDFERLEAQVLFTAVMTDTLIEE